MDLGGGEIVLSNAVSNLQIQFKISLKFSKNISIIEIEFDKDDLTL